VRGNHQKKMQKILINQHKRQDIFKCAHQAHFRFEKNVSVYHVLKEKNCYPSGCVWFVWKCKLLNKGNSCPKGYNYVGKNCFSCNQYFEEKVCYQPEILLDQKKFDNFKKSLEEYEEWLLNVNGKDIEFSGEVNSVKPHLKKILFSVGESLRFKGFLLSFKNGFIDRVFFDDYIYASVSRKSQERSGFAKGDKLDFKARLKIDHGRIVLERLRFVEFKEKLDNTSWDLSEALVARSVGAEFDCQPEKCLICEKGCLMDVVDKTQTKERMFRHLFCLLGVESPGECWYDLKKRVERQERGNISHS